MPRASEARCPFPGTLVLSVVALQSFSEAEDLVDLALMVGVREGEVGKPFLGLLHSIEARSSIPLISLKVSLPGSLRLSMSSRRVSLSGRPSTNVAFSSRSRAHCPFLGSSGYSSAIRRRQVAWSRRYSARSSRVVSVVMVLILVVSETRSREHVNAPRQTGVLNGSL